MHNLSRRARSIAALSGVLAPVVAHAHPGHEATQSLLAGLAHPLLGLDHVAAAVAVGAWAAQRSDRPRLALPLAFAVALICGVLAAGVATLHASGVEQLIAA